MSSNRPRREFRGGAPIETLDFDEEARRLWQRLNLDPTSLSGGRWNPADPIWRHPSGTGTIYVGNQTAAQDINMLRSMGVTHRSSQIPNYHEKPGTGIQYFRFPISFWGSAVDPTDESIVAFVLPMLTFVEDAVAAGHNVMVHCLAGAHRAGTTGCLLLMHFADLDAGSAVRTAKRLRSIIDPIGTLGMFLMRFEQARKSSAGQVLREGKISSELKFNRTNDQSRGGDR